MTTKKLQMRANFKMTIELYMTTREPQIIVKIQNDNRTGQNLTIKVPIQI